MALHNIITIHRENSAQADRAFAQLMQKTESILNERALFDSTFCRGISGSQLEKVAYQAIQYACSGTPFRAEEVKLISGAKFPDIIAETYFGVEVKSTIKDHWTSTGSSIVESTRDKNVDNIYLLFGKLGGNPVQFKCRPYQAVMSEIAVTHSPRYLIDMNTKRGDSIFDKMGVSYDTFRTSDDAIQQVRNYYRRKAELEGKIEMPWWLSDNSEEATSAMTVRIWNEVPLAERDHLIAQMFILFPEVIAGKYERASLWLCTAKSILNPNVRDTFSAGGKVYFVDKKKVAKSIGGYPKVFKIVVDHIDLIKTYLSNDDFIEGNFVWEFNKALNCSRPYAKWEKQIVQLSDAPILAEWFRSKPLLQNKM